MTGWFVENAEERAAVDEMEANPDRPAAIVMASLVETRLTLALDAVMEDHPNIKKDIFRPSGPLGSFSAKTDIALLFGFISPDAYRDLVLLRRIRNEFAHKLAPITFDTEPIKSMTTNFTLFQKQICHLHAKEEPTGVRFILKMSEYDLLCGLPRGRYMMTARLFVAGLDNTIRQKPFRLDPWL